MTSPRLAGHALVEALIAQGVDTTFGVPGESFLAVLEEPARWATLLQAPRPAQKLVHLHAGADELGRVYAADLLLQASMASAAKALEALAPPAVLAWADWTASAHADDEANHVPLPVQALDMAEVVMLARAYGFDAAWVRETAAFEPAFAAALECRNSTLLHLVLDVDVSTTRSTRSASRTLAQRSPQR